MRVSLRREGVLGRVAVLLPALIVALPFVIASGSVASAQTLQSVLVRTYQSNPTLAAERARQRSDDENVPRALAGFRPSVSANATYGPGIQRDQTGKTTTASPFMPGLTLDQTLYDSGKTAGYVSSAESSVFAGRATLRGVEQDVLLSAVTAYVDVLRDTAVVDLRRNNVENLRETLRRAQKRFDTGDVSRTDPAQAQARLAQGQANLATAISNLTASRATFRRIVGQDPQKLVFPDEPTSRLPASLQAALASAFDHHPAIRSAVHLVDVAASDLRVSKSALGPTVSVQGSASRTFGRTLDGTGSTSQFSVQANAPLYDGGVASADIRAAKETLGQRRIELEIARDQVRSDLRAAWGTLDAARAAIPAGETSVMANEIALAGVTNEEAEGQRTTLDVLNAQQELINARVNLAAARRDRVVAGYGLLAAAGSLTASRLALRTDTYRPETHYRQVRDLRYGTGTPDGR